MLVAPTSRLRFRKMTSADLDDMASMLAHPKVMQFYPAPKSRQEAADWIAWNQRNYRDYGHGLWIIETQDGEFVGDCGLTMQTVDGEQILEVGYHVTMGWQRQGYATEAAVAVLDAARAAGLTHVVAIIDPSNVASQRVAARIGLRLERRATWGGKEVLIFGADL